MGHPVATNQPTNQLTNQCRVTDSYYRETRYVILNQKRFLRILVREANAWIAVNASRKKIKHCLACRSQMLTFDWIDNRNGSKMIVGRNDTQRQLRSCTADNRLIASSKVFENQRYESHLWRKLTWQQLEDISHSSWWVRDRGTPSNIRAVFNGSLLSMMRSGGLFVVLNDSVGYGL